ncbi:MAG: hypothetical protein M3O36_09640 [Myxococcota bacterium]|nr:hypothetical protein [Myxococcota bacterium]
MGRALRPYVFVLLTACGYRSIYGRAFHGPDGATRLHVKLVRTLVPDVIASDEVVTGLREELARGGALAAGDGWPLVEVEVLREDESSEGITVVGRAPYARAVDLGLVARAWIVRSAGAPPERDTGDLRAVDVVAAEWRGGLPAARERVSSFHTADGLRAVAHRLGRKLAQRLEGYAGTSEEGVER